MSRAVTSVIGIAITASLAVCGAGVVVLAALTPGTATCVDVAPSASATLRSGERVADAATIGAAGDCTGGAWVNPLPPGSYQLTSPYGPRWGTLHAGQDFAAPTGTPIRAAAAATVLHAGCTSPFCDRPGALDAAGNPTTPGCGLRTILAHPNGVNTVYCHASTLAVHKGQTVAAGQVIGWVGSTGNSTGAHLHFEVRLRTSGNASTDPVAYLASVGVKV